MTAWPNQEYALGWIVTTRSWADGNVIAHDGSNTMFYATAWVAPTNDRAYLVVTNQGDAAATTDSAVAALIQAYPAK